MKTLFFPLLLGLTLCFSSCTYLINQALYGTNCETCRVVDCWGEVQWCSSECFSEASKEEMCEECEAYAETWGGTCECFMGED